MENLQVGGRYVSRQDSKRFINVISITGGFAFVRREVDGQFHIHEVVWSRDIGDYWKLVGRSQAAPEGGWPEGFEFPAPKQDLKPGEVVRLSIGGGERVLVSIDPEAETAFVAWVSEVELGEIEVFDGDPMSKDVKLSQLLREGSNNE